MATIVAGGRAIEVKNLTLSSTSDIQIGFINPCNSVIIKARTSVDIQIRASSGAVDYYTIPSGQSLKLDLVGNIKDGAVQPTNIWIRSVSATPVVEIIGLYGG